MSHVLAPTRWVLQSAVAGVSFVVAGSLIAMVRAYQVAVAPLLIGNCKFHPTCSQYFIEAVEMHGCVRGVPLGMRRLGRCHPFSVGGYDPVPPRKSNGSESPM